MSILNLISKTFFLAKRMSRLLTVLLLAGFAGNIMASPDIRPIDSANYPGTGDNSLYRMKVQYSDQCSSMTSQGFCTIWQLDTYVSTVTSYLATQSIVLEPGFSTTAGASLLLEIVPGYGVPQAANLTGTADPGINWIQSSTYDENGNLIGDSRKYYDNGGTLVQNQDKNFYRASPSSVYTHVLASAPIMDAYGRAAATTMAAPINYADFSYRANFLQHNASGAVYSHANFDVFNNGSTSTDKTNSPDQLWDATTGSPVIGTLAWYYSTQNSWEPYTPVTSYPYTRQTFYQDGTGAPKKVAGQGEPMIMGTGHEQSSFTAPVADELDFYLQVRNKFFPTTQVGASPLSMAGQAIETIGHDANGKELISISDQGGNLLLTARPGTDFTVNNTVTVGAAGSGGSTITYFKLLAMQTVTITGGSFTVYDMNTETSLSFTSGSTLPGGYYKLVNTGASSLTLTYSNGYTDISYYFFDQKGQELASLPPEGTKRLYGSPGLSTYSGISAVPYVTLFNFDVRGRLLSTQDPDGGLRRYIYRNDGKIRFSQNAVQAAAGSYSYTNYDVVGRPVESGQYLPDASGIVWGSAAMTGILENVSPGGGLTTGAKTDVMMTQYDAVDNSYYSNTGSSNLSGYVQDAANIGGHASVNRKYSSIINNSPTNANLVSATWFNYDEDGKVIWQINYLNGLGNGLTDAASYKTTDYTFDALNNLTKKVFQAKVASETFVHYYNYDPANNQLWHVYTNTVDNPATEMLQSTYYYYLHGGLKRVELATNLQGLDYTYTLRGDIKAINNSNNGSQAQDPGGDGTANGFSPDAFGEVIDYYRGDYSNTRSGIATIAGVNSSAVPAFITGGSGDSYVGNIKAMSWFSQKPTSSGASNAPTAYVYQYDGKYQFAGSTWGNNLTFGSGPATYTPTALNQETVGNASGGISPYDGNGNIQYVQRTNAAGAVTDQFSYQYGNANNQLTQVTNVATSQLYATYTYDANGQVTEETKTGSNPIYLAYDVLGKVTGVYQDQQHTLPIVTFVYDENGKRVKKVDYNTANQPINVTYYVGEVIYTQAVNNGVYQAVTPAEYQIIGASRIGVYYPQGPIYAYELTDHLGSVRAVVAVNANTLQVRAYSDYYPFGMVLAQGGTGDRYGYQGQNSEADPATGWNAFELRMYDSRIGRWLGIDPAGQFYSPYTGMGNDPVSGTDPDGGWDWYAHQNADGQISLINEGDGVHDASIDVEGEEWVNVGESSISSDQAETNADRYFADNQSYFGNFHDMPWDAGYLWEQYAYEHPSLYSSVDYHTPWIDIAMDELQRGVTRAAKGNNPRILEYLQGTLGNDASAKTQLTPWCACFINWTLKQAHIRGDGSAAAFGFNTTHYGQKLDRVAFGAILVLDFSHTTYAIGRNKDGRIVTLGGNQGANHSVTIGTISANNIIGIRYPNGYTPRYALPFYNVHGAPLSFSNTH